MNEYLVKLLVEILKKVEAEKILKDLIQNAKESLVCWLQAQAVASGTPLDDVAVGIIAAALGVDASRCKIPV